MEATSAQDSARMALACAPSYAPVSALDRNGQDQIPPLDTVLAENSFHDLAEGSNGLYGTRPDSTQQPTVVGGLIHSRERHELLRILELSATERTPQEVKLVIDLLTRCHLNASTPPHCWFAMISAFWHSSSTSAPLETPAAGPHSLKDYTLVC